MSCTEAFIAQLHERGFRLTPQREIVLRVLHDMEGHVTAEEIYGKVQALTSSVDISTVYRTLELLREFGLVASIDLDGGQRRYELLPSQRPHHHLRCRSCGKLITVEDAALQSALDHLCQTFDFKAELDQWIIPGLCKTCRGKSDHA